MQYLIYEVFSGVGFCNQLFSLETAVYLANITQRRLILLVRHPLCHCGRARWDYGHLLDFFSKDFESFLPHGYAVHYRTIPDSVLKLTQGECEVFEPQQSFSSSVFVDSAFDTTKNATDIQKFCAGRTKVVYSFDKCAKEVLYIKKSNASRCFYNFYTSGERYLLMSKIANALRNLNSDIVSRYTQDTFDLAIHLRLGDHQKSTEVIDKESDKYADTLMKRIEGLAGVSKIVVMCDRKDGKLLETVKSKYKVTFTDDLVKTTGNPVKDFLVEKHLCERSKYFIGTSASTVSHYINYSMFVQGKESGMYNTKVVKAGSDYSWNLDRVEGPSISWKWFWQDNVQKNLTAYLEYKNSRHQEYTNIILKKLKFNLNETLVFNNDGRLLVCLIEFRELHEIEHVMASILKVYKPYEIGISVMYGNQNKNYIENMFKNWNNIIFIKYDLFNIDRKIYSSLLKQPEFYEKFNNWSHVLIIQTDALIMRKIDDVYFNYDYIGAPWSKTNQWCKYNAGNGGFSLRNIKSCIKVCEQFRGVQWFSIPTQNEDGFFCNQASFNYPPLNSELHKAFSVEKVKFKHPIGCHQIYHNHSITANEWLCFLDYMRYTLLDSKIITVDANKMLEDANKKCTEEKYSLRNSSKVSELLNKKQNIGPFTLMFTHKNKNRWIINSCLDYDILFCRNSNPSSVTKYHKINNTVESCIHKKESGCYYLLDDKNCYVIFYPGFPNGGECWADINANGHFRHCKDLPQNGAIILKASFQSKVIRPVNKSNITENCSKPFLSIDLWLQYCNLVIDEKYKKGCIGNYSYESELIDTFDKHKEPVIFLKTDLLPYYIDILNSLKNPYTLITSSNDDHCPPYLVFPENETEYPLLKTKTNKLLNESKLKVWYAKNPAINHHKLIAYPLGPKWQWKTTRFFGENKNEHLKLFHKYGLNPEENMHDKLLKQHLLYFNFNQTTNNSLYQPYTNIRQKVKSDLLNNGFKMNINESFEEYIKTLSTYKFCVAPPGRGIDTHRCWEALMVGTIPIVKSSSLNELYEQLPVVIVDSYDIITENFLNTKYHDIFKIQYNFEKIYSEFWIQKIFQKQ